METFQTPCGGVEPGIFELVTKALEAGPRCPIMTVEEVQRLGALDPVGVEIDTDEWLSIEKKPDHMPDDGPKIMEIVSKLQVSDEVMTGLFGLCPTDRDRSMNLFRGGNIVTDSVRITSGVTRGPNSEDVWIISSDVVASRRTRVYRTRVVFSQVTGKPLNKPAGSCECVAHLGWCSHQVSLLLFVNFLQLFPMTTLTSEFRRVYPPSVFVVQREGCPWSHATSKETKTYVKTFENLKYDGPKKPEKMREIIQLLVPRVRAQREKWLKQVNTPDKKHQFAADEVIRGV